EEFAVNAYRFRTEPLETPVNSTYISSEKIEKSPYTNVADAIRNFGNVNFRSVTGSSASGDFGMRGFGENSQTRLLVVVDGQKFNRADMGSINWLQIPLSDVESIEILRGAQTAMYGSSASSGVIKISTRRAEEGADYYLQGVYGSYKTYNLAARASGREGEYFYTVALNYFDSDGWRENSQNNAASANLSLGWDINEKNTITLSGNYTDSVIHYPGPLTYAQYQDNPRQSDGNNSEARSKDGVYTLTLENESSCGEGAVGLGWNFRDINWTLGGRTKNFQWTATFSPRYKFEIGERAHAIVGFDGEYGSIDFKNLYSGDSPYKGFSDLNQISAAPYFGGDVKFFDRLTITAVGRVDSSKLEANNTEYKLNSLDKTITIPIPGGTITIPNPNYPPQINPLTSYQGKSLSFTGLGANFGANYEVSENLSLFFKFDQIYHYPTTDEIAYYQTYGGITGPSGGVLAFNDALSPERGQNYEIGAKIIGGGWTFVASAYLNDLTDEIAYYPVPAFGGGTAWINTNLPPTQRLGTDIEARYDAERWGVGAMFSAVRARFSGGVYDGNCVPLVPNFTGNIT
ncbi:MAG: TonB-dependent receptor, partial [Opitutales bacterium]|nr:TonB-dependent receptor [Opitutales bacterium]